MAGSTRQSRDVKKFLAARRAGWRLKQSFDTIDFNEDVVNPELEALLSGKVQLEIESNSTDAADSIIRIVIQDNTEETDETGSDSGLPVIDQAAS